MKELIKKTKNIIGLDLIIIYTVLSRIIQGLGGVVSVFFIVKYLDVYEQGYYYTFASIIALQVFFELGLTNIIIQFISKYFVGLEIVNGKISGDYKNISYISSIFNLSIKWFSYAFFLFTVIISIVGVLFFKFNQKDNVDWLFPWILTCFSTSMLLLTIPFLSFISGINKMLFASKIRFWQYFSQFAIMIILFVMDFGLYARPVSIILSVLLIFLSIYKSIYLKILLDISKRHIENYVINYRKDIFHFQWKITLSWLSGYLIFQLFNPIIFAFDGSVSAGKMGMTLVLLGGVQTIAISWITTKLPMFSEFVTLKKFAELDSIFKKTFIQSSILCTIGLVCILIILFLLKSYNFYLVDKFLDINSVILLSIATLANHIMSSLAIYLRSYLKEPLMIMSIVVGLLISTLSLILVNIYGVKGVVFSYFSIMTFVCFPWTVIIYKKCKKLWQVV